MNTQELYIKWHKYRNTLPLDTLTTSEILCMRTAFFAGYEVAVKEVEDWFTENFSLPKKK